MGNAMKKDLPNIIYLRVVRRKRTPRCTLLGKIANSKYHKIMHDHKNYGNGWLLKNTAFIPVDRLEKFPNLASKKS